MRYATFRKSGLFVGSGAVEAGCRAVIGQRLQLSGMRWNTPGATGILTLRCHDASDRWDPTSGLTTTTPPPQSDGALPTNLAPPQFLVNA